MSESENLDLEKHRSAVKAINYRFSPHVQSIRSDFIDFQVVRLLGESAPMTLKEIQETFREETGGHFVQLTTFEHSIDRLEETGKIKSEEESREEVHLYKLTKEAQSEFEEEQKETKKEVEKILSELFEGQKKPSSYFEPFFQCLAVVFSRWGEECIDVVMKENKAYDSYLNENFVQDTLEEVSDQYSFVELPVLRDAFAQFFENNYPSYNQIKWNMAQNYFAQKILGLEDSIEPLLKSKFEDAHFYLDTNLLIAALEPAHKFHDSFLAINGAASELGVSLVACRSSIKELERWRRSRKDTLREVRDNVPEGCMDEIRSVFYQKMKEATDEEGDNIDTIFATLDSPEKKLQGEFGVEVVDDNWFNKARNFPEVEKFAKKLKFETDKFENPAIHDSILLHWIIKMRKQREIPDCLVTADASLLGKNPQIADTIAEKTLPLVISKDILLQWIAPKFIGDGSVDLTEVFAEMIKTRVLPQRQLLDLKDFEILKSLSVNCKNLSKEAVRKATQFIQNNYSNMDLSNAEDREELSYELNKHLAGIKLDKESKMKDLGKRIGELQKDLEGEKDKREQAEDTLANMQDELKGLKKDNERIKLRGEAKVRLVITGIIALLVEGVTLFTLAMFGAQDKNLLMRIIAGWYLWGLAGPAISIGLGWLIIGKERLRALGWPFSKLFKLETSEDG